MGKQQSRAQYHVGERQLRNYFEEASRRGSNVGAASLQLLETRIDAMVLRAGCARTIGGDGARLRELPQAAQIGDLPVAAGGGVLFPVVAPRRRAGGSSRDPTASASPR